MWAMPPRPRRQPGAPGPQRAGARRGALRPEVRNALREEARRLTQLEDPVDRVKAVGDFFAALDRELARVANVRLTAIGQMHRSGMSYDTIAAATGLSKSRVAQLLRESRQRRRPAP